MAKVDQSTSTHNVLEPVATLDLDIFIGFRPEAGQFLVSPERIFQYLKARNGTVQGEYVVVAGWPVQFLPAGTPLLEEALKQAVLKDVDGISTRVFTVEHLAAIALQTVLTCSAHTRANLRIP